MLYLTTAEVTKVTNFLVTNGWYTIPKKAGAYDEITVLQQLHAHWSNVVSSGLQSQVPGLKDISFNFLGLNLGSMPDWKFAVNVNWSDTTSWLPALGLFLIPIISAVLSWASMKVSNLSNPPDPKTQAQMKSMNLLMPLMSIWFCFIMPAALGVYWIANSVFGMARDYWLTIHYRKRLDAEDAERESQRSEREKQMEAKRQETERLKEEGRTEVNSNTSKRKMQAKEKQTYEERRAAAEKAEKAERRARRGLSANDAPPSQVGNRRFARGRAYDPERFGDQQDPVSAGEGNTIPEQPEYDAEEPADSVEGVGIDAAADEAEDTAYDEDADTAEDADAAEEPDEDEDSDK
jgi:YidC/Oxa1 family membrane protein insertase